MIFVDTNVFMYAVGRPHALQGAALAFLREAENNAAPLCTSAEVLQELCHVYMSTNRLNVLDGALGLIANMGVEVWPLEVQDVLLARRLHSQYPALDARDLCHLAVCRRKGVREIMTFDRDLAGAAPPAVHPEPVEGPPFTLSPSKGPPRRSP